MIHLSEINICFIFFSYKWYIPFTHTIETVGSINNDTFEVTPDNLWKNVKWIFANETSSKFN